MPSIHQLSRRLPVTLAALALTVSVGACGGDDQTDRAVTHSVGLDAGTTTSAPGASDGGETTTSAPGESDSGETTTSQADQPAGLPQDSDLDIEMRNPDGTRLTLDHIAFEGDNIMVHGEVYNGSSTLVYFHDSLSVNGAAAELRLVDDAGNTYHFLMPPEEGPSVFVDQGETVSGTFTFLGPLVGHPQQLRLVTNVAPEDVDSWSLADEEGNRPAIDSEPGFVVPIDLTWD